MGVVTKSSILPKKEWEKFIEQSYELVKAKLTKRVRMDLGI
jgi:predicted DNA-binding protein (MmcQ/YjbR family)